MTYRIDMYIKMNRNPCKQWEITYPQCAEMKRQDFAESFPPYHDVIVAEEEHKDGGVHLHMGVKFKKGITKSKLLAWIKIRYPNDWKRIHFSPLKSVKAFWDYCQKEDPTPYCVKSTGKHWQRSERRMNEILDQYKFLYNGDSWKEAWNAFVEGIGEPERRVS